MSLLQPFFEVTSWCLFLYMLATVIIVVIYRRSRKLNIRLKQKIEKWISAINFVFVIWFVLFTIHELIIAERRKREWGFAYGIDTSMWVMALSAALFVLLLCQKKFRKSPYSMVGISIIILINFIIAYSEVAIVV